MTIACLVMIGLFGCEGSGTGGGADVEQTASDVFFSYYCVMALYNGDCVIISDGLDKELKEIFGSLRYWARNPVAVPVRSIL